MRTPLCSADDEPGGRWGRGERERGRWERKEREKTRRQKRPLQVVSVSESRGREGGRRHRGGRFSSKATGQQSQASIAQNIRLILNSIRGEFVSRLLRLRNVGRRHGRGGVEWQKVAFLPSFLSIHHDSENVIQRVFPTNMRVKAMLNGGDPDRNENTVTRSQQHPPENLQPGPPLADNAITLGVSRNNKTK